MLLRCSLYLYAEAQLFQPKHAKIGAVGMEHRAGRRPHHEAVRLQRRERAQQLAVLRVRLTACEPHGHGVPLASCYLHAREKGGKRVHGSPLQGEAACCVRAVRPSSLSTRWRPTATEPDAEPEERE